MRYTCLLVLAIGCSGGGAGDMGSGDGGLSLLTVNDTLSTCTVTVTVGSAAPSTFDSASRMFMATAGTKVALHAVPMPKFLQVVWSNVTSKNGADATYVMDGSPEQNVTACCPETNGGGC